MFIGTKYKPEELQAMALVVLEDEVRFGSRSMVLYMRMHQLTGIHPNEVRKLVVALASGVY